MATVHPVVDGVELVDLEVEDADLLVELAEVVLTVVALVVLPPVPGQTGGPGTA